jgi:predicted transcriptional regulator
MLDLLVGYWISRMLHAVARAGIADRLAKAPQTAKQLAQASGTNAAALHRVLRALASVGVFKEDKQRRFALTPLGETLRSDVAGSMHAFALMMPDDYNWSSWAALERSLEDGGVAFERVHGQRIFDWLGRRPREMEVFSRSMGNLSAMEAPAVAAALELDGVRTLVDVAGAHGGLLATILKANPKLRGVLFDLPDVIEQARQSPVWRSRALSSRVEFVSGDYLQEVPAGADAYIMKYIVHDLDDGRAVKLLKNCRRAMNQRGRVLVVDAVIPPGNDPSWGKLLDVNMLVLTGGSERTREEFSSLLGRAGLRLARILATACPLSVVEAAAV